MNELVVFNEVAATLAQCKVENEKLVFDYADPKGEKEARSHIAKLRTVKTKITDVHRDAKAEALALCKALDGKKRDLIGEVEGMIAVHKDPLDAIEAEKQAKIEVERKRLEELEQAEAKRLQEEQAKRLAEIEAREAAVRTAEEKLTAEKAATERIDREKHIAEEAAERARIQAAQKAETEAKAKELAEIRRREVEEAAEKKRIENKKHRAKIEEEIRSALANVGFDTDVASRILAALKENRIPHVSINY